MSALSIQPTYPIFTDIDGQPLEAGYVWIGTASLDPQTNPINVYWDAALTILAPQPIRTLAGYPSNNGTPARLYVNSDYSIRVMNRNGSSVYSAPTATERYSGVVISSIDASKVTFTQAGSTTEITVDEYLKGIAVTPEQFGALGDNVTNDYQALQDAFDTGKPVYLNAQYFTTTTLTPSENQIIFGRGSESMIRGDGGAPVIDFAGTSGTHKERLTLRDFTIKRTNGVFNPLQRQLVEFHYADDCTVENMVFDGDNATSAYPGALIGYSVTRMRIVGCDFIGGASCNLTSEGALSTNAFSEGCLVKNCYMAPAPSQGFDFYYVNDLIVDGCIAHGRTSTFGCGFIIEYQGVNITFTNCISYDNTRSGFYLEPNVAQGLAAVTFNNCIAYSNGESGLYAQNSFGLVVNGGAYHGSLTSFTGSNAGIALEDVSQQCTITGAYIFSNQVCGLRVATGVGNTISGNVFYNNNGPAILYTAVSQNQNITGNTFVGNVSIISGWVESQTGTFSDFDWASYTPVVYSNDGATPITLSNVSVKYKKIAGQTCLIHGYFEFAGSALNDTIYITAPFTVERGPGGNTGPGASTMRGTAKGSASAVLPVASLFFPASLSISGMTVSDTSVTFTATYEIA
jgi:hypothetical protein